MTTAIIFACLFGHCVSHGDVLQIPLPSVHPGQSEATFLREYNGPSAVIIYVPAGASI